MGLLSWISSNKRWSFTSRSRKNFNRGSNNNSRRTVSKIFLRIFFNFSSIFLSRVKEHTELLVARGTVYKALGEIDKSFRDMLTATNIDSEMAPAFLGYLEFS